MTTATIPKPPRGWGLRKSRGFDLWDCEKVALKPPADITVSEWAEQFRILDEKNSAEAGPWDNARHPALIGIMDAWTDPGVSQITVMKCVQFGLTEAALNILCYIIDQDPGPTMLVYPRREDCEYMSQKRLAALIEANPAVQKHLTGNRSDVKKMEIAFTTCLLYLGATTSPGDLCSKPIRYLIMDEVDRYATWTRGEGNPMELARDRTTTFWNRKVILFSTPTVRDGNIAVEFAKSDQRRLWVPCPLCHEYQTLVFDQVKVPDEERDPVRIRAGRLAWYECKHCGGKIEDNRAKDVMVKSGVWCPQGGHVNRQGEVVDAKWSDHAGFHISALYSPWRSWSEVVAKFFEVRSNPADLQVFVNQWLGETWEEGATETTETQIRKHCLGYRRGRKVPGAVQWVTAGVDVQKDHMFFIVRGWDDHLNSWLLDWGRVESWASIRKYVFNGEWDGHRLHMAGVDSGYDTWTVYQECMDYPDVARPVKGGNRNTGQAYQATRVEKHPVTGASIPGGLVLWVINTAFMKDRILRLQTTEEGQAGEWFLPEDISDDYIRQVTAERRVFDRDKRTGVGTYVWVPKYHGVANHYWDCEVYATAMAHMLRIGAPVEEPVRRDAPTNTRNARAQERPSGRRRDGGWMKGRRGR